MWWLFGDYSKIQKPKAPKYKHTKWEKKPLHATLCHSVDWHGDVLITHNIYLSIVLFFLFSVLFLLQSIIWLEFHTIGAHPNPPCLRCAAIAASSPISLPLHSLSALSRYRVYCLPSYIISVDRFAHRGTVALPIVLTLWPSRTIRDFAASTKVKTYS